MWTVLDCWSGPRRKIDSARAASNRVGWRAQPQARSATSRAAMLVARGRFFQRHFAVVLNSSAIVDDEEVIDVEAGADDHEALRLLFGELSQLPLREKSQPRAALKEGVEDVVSSVAQCFLSSTPVKIAAPRRRRVEEQPAAAAAADEIDVGSCHFDDVWDACGALDPPVSGQALQLSEPPRATRAREVVPELSFKKPHASQPRAPAVEDGAACERTKLSARSAPLQALAAATARPAIAQRSRSVQTPAPPRRRSLGVGTSSPKAAALTCAVGPAALGGTRDTRQRSRVAFEDQADTFQVWLTALEHLLLIVCV